MKKLSASTYFVLMLTLTQSTFAEPLRLERAGNVARKGQVELGLESRYAVDEFTLKGVTGTDFTVTTWENALFLRYGLADWLELIADFPHASLKTEQEASGTITSTTNSGMGDIQAALKINKVGAGKSLAYGLLLNVELPSGNSDKFLGEGFDFHPQALVSRKMGQWPIDLNTGYNLTGNYKVKGTKIEPADVLTYGISVGRAMGNWTALVEGRSETFGKEKQAGQKVVNSNGSRYEVTPGLRWQRKNLKLKSGISISLGDESHRLYDWKVFVGVSVLGKFSLKIGD